MQPAKADTDEAPMTTLSSNPYWGISRVELHEARQRAEVQRAIAIRQIFTALVAWRRKSQWDRSVGSAGNLQPVASQQHRDDENG